MNVSATVPLTGEVIEHKADTPADIVTAYRLVSQTIDACEKVKKQLQKRAQGLLDAGEPVEHDGYQMRSYTTQRMNYDPAVMRQVFDEDLMATLMEPAKTRIDDYIKEHLNEMGDASTALRTSMVPIGRPYTVTRLERLS